MRFQTSIRVLLLVAMLILLLSGMSLAQSLTEGAMSGTVTDQTDSVLANATVKITSMEKGFSQETATNAQGVLQFPLVQPGVYLVEIDVKGFKEFSAKATVNLGQATVVMRSSRWERRVPRWKSPAPSLSWKPKPPI